MRHGHTLARERFLRDFDAFFQPEVDDYNEWRKKNDRNGARKKALKVGGYIKEKFGETAYGHYKTICDGVKNGDLPGLKKGAWERLKADIAGLDVFEQRFKGYLAANDWAVCVRERVKRLSFDELRDGRSVESLRSNQVFYEWAEALLKDERFPIAGYSILDGLKKYRLELELVDEGRYSQRQQMVAFYTALSATEQLNADAFEDICDRDFFRAPSVVEVGRDIHGSLEEKIQEGMVLSLCDLRRRIFRAESGGAKHDLKRIVRLHELLLSIAAAVDSDDMTDRANAWDPSIIAYGNLEVEGIKSWIWLVGDAKRREEADALAQNGLGAHRRFLNGDFFKMVGQANLIEGFDEYSLAMSAALAEPRIGDVLRTKTFLEHVLNRIEKGATAPTVSLIVDWHDTCAKLFDAAGYGKWAARTYDCMADVYRQKKRDKNLESLRRKEAEAMDRRGYADIAPDGLNILKEAISNRALVKLVT